MADNTPLYNLKAVVQETGLSPATLRAWERRYGLIRPQRSPGGHRLYAEQDIAMLKWLVARQAEGLSISRAIEMWRSSKEVTSDHLKDIVAPRPAVVMAGTSLDDLRRQWVSACLVFDEGAAEQALSQALAIGSPESICIEVLQRGLAEIGAGWAAGSVSVQQEHFASALAMRRINTLFAVATAPTRPGRLLAVCPPGEAHDFVLLLAAFLLRRHSWDVVYLGANVPLSQLDTTLRATSPQMVISCAQTLSGAASLREMSSRTSAHGVPLAFGGGIFSLSPDIARRIPGYYLGNDLTALPQTVERLLTWLPPLPIPQPIPHDYTQALTEFRAKAGLVVAAVTSEMVVDMTELPHLEDANATVTQCIVSALELGDINLLGPSLAWLSVKLRNQGGSPDLATRYYTAYRRAIQAHLGEYSAIILLGLSHL